MSGHGSITRVEIQSIGIIIEGFCYGLYSAIFYACIRHHASKELGIDKRSIFFYALCILYILSTIVIVIDITRHVIIFHLSSTGSPRSLLAPALHLYYTVNVISGLCDFISQAILIYQCWVIWGCDIRVIVIPLILAFAYLATWLAVNCSIRYVGSSLKFTTISERSLIVTSLAISLTVNALVTGLIVFKIFKVYWETRPTPEERTWDVGANSKLRSIIFLIIVSGMAMLTVQLIRIATHECNAAYLIIGIYQMSMGLTPTIVFVRVLSMGLSSYDKASVVETVDSLRFAPVNEPDDDDDLNSEMKDDQEKIDDDIDIATTT